MIVRTMIWNLEELSLELKESSRKYLEAGMQQRRQRENGNIESLYYERIKEKHKEDIEIYKKELYILIDLILNYE